AEIAEHALEHGLHDVARAEPRSDPRPPVADVVREAMVDQPLDARIEAARDLVEGFPVVPPRALEEGREGEAFGHGVEFSTHGRSRTASRAQGCGGATPTAET